MADRARPKPIAILVCLFGVIGLGLSGLQGCSRGEIRGTYAVEIRIAEARAPLEGVLVLSTSMLGVPARRLGDPGSDGIGDDGDYGSPPRDPNSCLILPSDDPADPTARSVTLFDTRIRGGELELPLRIFEIGDQYIEIVKLQRFADAIGGEVVFHEADGERPGLLVGEREGEASAARCVEELERFDARIRELLEASPEDPDA